MNIPFFQNFCSKYVTTIEINLFLVSVQRNKYDRQESLGSSAYTYGLERYQNRIQFPQIFTVPNREAKKYIDSW